jgi:thymidylate synthase/dihydrofolate reductase
MELGINLIYCVDNAGTIGINNTIPWDALDDMNYFHRTTTAINGIRGVKYNYLIMGRITYESMPKIMSSCPYRRIIVLSRDLSMKDAIKDCLGHKDLNEIFVIGGVRAFVDAIGTGLVKKIHHCSLDVDSQSLMGSESISHVVTLPNDVKDKILHMTQTNAFHKSIAVKIAGTELIVPYTVTIFESEPFELQYLALLKEVVNNGTYKLGRNGATKSINDVRIKINLQDGFPISTLKRTFFRGIVCELLWMIRGQTDAKILSNDGINIWNANSSKEYLDAKGLNYRPGDIGPGYGFQMRHFGGDYFGCDVPSDNGRDQLMDCINAIKTNPNDRRIIISLWNPLMTNLMALPPCHLLYQFTVSDGKLNCHLYQRSWDILLGWNTSTAALLTHILAHFTGLDVGMLTHTICDLHVYDVHMDSINEMFNRVPYKLPKLVIYEDVPSDINDYRWSQFKLESYMHHPSISLEMQA